MKEERHFYIHVHLMNRPNDCFWHTFGMFGEHSLLSVPILATAVPESKLPECRRAIKRMFGAQDEDIINVPCTNDLLTPAMRELINVE